MKLNLRFKAVFDREKLDSVPFYALKDSSFGCEPISGDCSIMIDYGYTSLDMSLIDNTICGISGYNPKENWIRKKLIFPKSKALGGQLKLINKESIPIGSALTYNRVWSTFFDPESNVICIGNTNLYPYMTLVEFCTNMIATLKDDKLVSIWLLPVFRS